MYLLVRNMHVVVRCRPLSANNTTRSVSKMRQFPLGHFASCIQCLGGRRARREPKYSLVAICFSRLEIAARADGGLADNDIGSRQQQHHAPPPSSSSSCRWWSPNQPSALARLLLLLQQVLSSDKQQQLQGMKAANPARPGGGWPACVCHSPFARQYVHHYYMDGVTGIGSVLLDPGRQ
jgi:hypothetical protein